LPEYRHGDVLPSILKAGGDQMKILQVGGVIVVTAITAVCLAAMGKKVINIQPSALAESAISKESSSDIALLAVPEEAPKVELLTLSEKNSGPKEVETQPATSEDVLSVQTRDQTQLQEDFSLREKQQARSFRTSLIILMPNSRLKESRRTSF
jgi:hypothetical protein